MRRWLFLLALAVPARARASDVARPEIALDARVELCADLHLLAARAGGVAAPGFRDDGGAYARELLAATVAFSTHPAVAAYARALRRPAPEGFRFMTPLHEIRRCLSDDLRLRADRADCRSSALAFAAEDFARRARFRDVMVRLRALARADLETLEAGRGTRDLVAGYESYTRLKAGGERVAPSPLLESGRAWNDLDRGDDGSYVILTVISPSSATGRFDWLQIQRDVGHEHSHALFDAAVDAADAAAGRPPTGEGTDCYDSWKQCLREHVAQGVSLRLVQRARAAGLPSPDPAPNARVTWHARAADILREYEADPARYPTLLDFVPTYVARLRQVAFAAPPAEKPAISTSNVSAESAESPESRMRRGVAQFQSGRLQEAAETFSSAFQYGGGAEALMSLAVVERALGKPKEARVHLDEAVDLARKDGADPQLSDALSSRADLRAAQNDAAGAAADIVEALAAAPLDWPRRAESEKRLRELRIRSSRTRIYPD